MRKSAKNAMGALKTAGEDASSPTVFVFRGIEYVISASTSANGRTLVVEAEDKLTADQWRGKFDSACECTIVYLRPGL